MKYSNKAINNLFDYYIGQIYKMLGLFESKDRFGYKHVIKIMTEINMLDEQFPTLNDDYRMAILISKLENLVEELYFLDGEHQFIKNRVMESCNLLSDIKEGLLK